MKVITAYSHKGGTGKTTSLLMLASAIESMGATGLLIDCDPHQSFRAFKRHSVTEDANLWSDRMEVKFLHYEATTQVALESELMDADESGRYDYCLLNLTGTDHPFNRHVLRYAELTLLPFAPAALDLMELPAALDVIRQLGEDGEIGQARVVFSRMKSKMNAAQTAYMGAALEGFPVMKTHIRDTAIMGDLVMRGLLGVAVRHMEPLATGLQKAEVLRLKEALVDCQALLKEVDDIIAEQEAAA
jgi:chromosome partitioning protein